jgi:hypothetical protein
MRKRASILVLALMAALGAGADGLPTLARSTCRVHHYFEELKTASTSMNSLERLMLSLILAQTQEQSRQKS